MLSVVLDLTILKTEVWLNYLIEFLIKPTHFTTVHESCAPIRAILSSPIYFIFVTKYYHPNDTPSTSFILKNVQYYRYDILWWLMNHVCTYASLFKLKMWNLFSVHLKHLRHLLWPNYNNYIVRSAYNNILDECIYNILYIHYKCVYYIIKLYHSRDTRENIKAKLLT